MVANRSSAQTHHFHAELRAGRPTSAPGESMVIGSALRWRVVKVRNVTDAGRESQPRGGWLGPLSRGRSERTNLARHDHPQRQQTVPNALMDAVLDRAKGQA